MIKDYQVYVQPSFDKVLNDLKAEYEEAKKTGKYDDLTRHILKGWSKEEAKDGQRIHGHQRRMPNDSLKKAIKAFNGFFTCFNPIGCTFEDLYDEVKRRLTGIPFCEGPLTVYDVAIRIGWIFGILPKVYVYLNSGALVGAKRLLGKKSLPFRIPVSDFPAPLCNVPSIYIEDILCTFKDAFLPKSDPDYKTVSQILGIGSCNAKPSRKRWCNRLS